MSGALRELLDKLNENVEMLGIFLNSAHLTPDELEFIKQILDTNRATLEIYVNSIKV